MADWNDLKGYIGTDSAEDDQFIQTCWDQAEALIDGFVGLIEVPEAVLDRATLEVGNELFNRKNAPSGASQFAVFEGGATQPVRGPRDPLAQVYPMLRRWVLPF